VSQADLPEPFRVVWAPPHSLARHVACTWAERTGSAQTLLPDGAVELVWSGRGLFVRGADTRPHEVDAFPGRTFVAVRFRPGAAADVLGLRGRELADARVGISVLWGRAEMERLERSLAACRAPRAAADVLEDAIAARAQRPLDPAVAAIVAALRMRREPVLVAALADRIGYSERQLRRRCVAALGYGPKTLDRILRFQRFRGLAARDRRLSLAELAAAAGYADQSHLNRECLRLAGETPAAHLAGPRRPFRSRQPSAVAVWSGRALLARES
jgi:AraC-like DNA-binding protein